MQAEADGFASLWYPSAVLGDPLAAMALAGRETQTIGLGTAVLQTYTCHPVLQANRGAGTAAVMGRPGLTLGVGPSHRVVIEDVFGLSYDNVGAHTEEYVTVLGTLLRGEGISHRGEHFKVDIPIVSAPPQPVSVMLSALAPRLLRVRGRAHRRHDPVDGQCPLDREACRARGSTRRPRAPGDQRPASSPDFPSRCTTTSPKLATLPRATFANYGTLPNYRRILDIGGHRGRPTPRSSVTRRR